MNYAQIYHLMMAGPVIVTGSILLLMLLRTAIGRYRAGRS